MIRASAILIDLDGSGFDGSTAHSEQIQLRGNLDGQLLSGGPAQAVQLRLDARVAVPFELAAPQPLRRRERRRRQPLAQRLSAPLAGVGALLISALRVSLLPPTPRAPLPSKTPAAAPAQLR